MKLLQPDPFPCTIRAIRGEQYLWSSNCCSSHIQLIVWHIHENSVCHDFWRLISNPGNSPEEIVYVCVHVSTLYLLLNNSPMFQIPFPSVHVPAGACYVREVKKKNNLFFTAGDWDVYKILLLCPFCLIGTSAKFRQSTNMKDFTHQRFYCGKELYAQW